MQVRARAYEVEEGSEEKDSNFTLFSLTHVCSYNLEEA